MNIYGHILVEVFYNIENLVEKQCIKTLNPTFDSKENFQSQHRGDANTNKQQYKRNWK